MRCVVSVLVAGTSLLVYLMATFSTSIDTALSQGMRVQGDQRVLSITDDAEDDGGYEQYFKDPNGPLRPLHFYQRLSHARHFTYATTMNQPVFVEPFPGIAPFVQTSGDGTGTQQAFPDPALGGRPAVALSTMLMNEAAWQVFALKTSDGAGLDWGSVDYDLDEIPVVVGSQMAQVKPVGSRMTADYYDRRVVLKVVAVLQPLSVIHTSADENTSLDRSVVVPYPRQIRDASAGGRHREFYQSVVSNLTHGDLYHDASTPVTAVEHEVALAARVSDFPEYVYMNASNVLVQYRLMRAILEQQQSLVAGIAAIVGVIVLFLTGAASMRLSQLRSSWVQTSWMLGVSRAHLTGTAIAGHATYGSLALAGLVAGIATTGVRGGERPFVAALIVLGAMLAIDITCAVRLTHRTIEAGPVEGDARA